MKTLTISKSLEEVWKWKEICYEESKGLTVKDYLEKIHKDVKKTLEEAGFTEEGGKIKRR